MSLVLSIFLISTGLLVWLAISTDKDIFAFFIFGEFVVYVFLLIIWLYKTIKHYKKNRNENNRLILDILYMLSEDGKVKKIENPDDGEHTSQGTVKQEEP
ncbi:MAG: hypothetical protein K5751_00105 [Treponemataceae bacterium]|nr:hypothetical protein [Treponemataceae bacterium]